uniref:Uncharacterized protein n=1 Tax=Globodera rostochiensis TaxID=31243 RepID=A0A914H886_GLORO
MLNRLGGRLRPANSVPSQLRPEPTPSRANSVPSQLRPEPTPSRANSVPSQLRPEPTPSRANSVPSQLRPEPTPSRANSVPSPPNQLRHPAIKKQPQQQLDLRENGIQTEHLLDKLVTKHLETTTIWWPQQIDHFIGSISSALIVFERDVHKLTFTPFLYYFQKSELLHRNVFNEPPSAEEPLAPTGCGQFKVPEKAK